MAFPQNAVEQLSRRPTDARSPGWFGQLLMFSTTMLFLSVGIFFGLKYGYHTYLTQKNEEKKKEIAAFSVKYSTQQQEQLINFYSQLQNLNSVLDKHVITSPLFSWIEASTISSVYFSRMAVNVTANQVTLSGYARSLADFSQQLKVFQDRSNDVARVNFSNVSADSRGLWQFDLTLFMRPGFFGGAVAATPTPGSGQPQAAQPNTPAQTQAQPQAGTPQPVASTTTPRP